MDLLRRKLPDGRKGPGLLVYVAIFGVPMLLLLLVLKGEKKTNQMLGHGVNIPRVSQAVQTATPVEEPQAPATLPSTRALAGASELTQTAERTAGEDQRPRASTPPANALDAAVAEANRPVDRDRPEIPQPAGLPGAVREAGASAPVLPPSPGDTDTNPLRNGLGAVAGGAGGSNQVVGTVADLVVYRRPAAHPADHSAPQVPAAPPARFAPGSFLPRGYYLELYLLDTVRTDQPQPIVTFGVARDAVFGRKVFIPFGTRLLATVQGSPTQGTRVQISPSSFQFPDGSELSVSGVIKGLDNAASVPAYYIPPPTWVQLSGYVNDFMSGYLDLLYLRQQEASRLTIGSVSVGTTQSVFDYKSEALSTTSNVIRDFAKKQMDELQSRYAPYLTVPAGTKVFLQLTAPLSPTDRGVNVAQLKAVEQGKSAAQQGVEALGGAAAGASGQAAALNGLAAAITSANRGQ